ncbi:MAG: enoyl-CoA hydratase/isomerase family protein [Sporomusa sp.]
MSNIKISVKNGIAVITMDKQPLNIVEKGFYIEIKEAFDKVSAMPDVSVVILNSNCRHFCAGGDLNEIKSITDEETKTIVCGAVVACATAIYECKQPVIAAVHGKAIGAGTALAACCDIIVAAEDAIFSVPEITVGYIGASEFLEMIIPRRLARYYIYTGKPLTALDMKSWGAVLDVVPRESLMDSAYKIANEIALQSPLALKYFKAAMNHNDNERLGEKYLHEADYMLQYSATEDFKETMDALFEKRKPIFKGK